MYHCLETCALSAYAEISVHDSLDKSLSDLHMPGRKNFSMTERRNRGCEEMRIYIFIPARVLEIGGVYF